MTRAVRLLIVDDQPRARQSLCALLSTWHPASEVMEASDGLEAIRLVETHQPAIVLMDIRMPHMDGLQATRTIKVCWPGVQVIVLTLYSEYQAEALAAGADAFLGKGESPDRLLAMLTTMIAQQSL